MFQKLTKISKWGIILWFLVLFVIGNLDLEFCNSKVGNSIYFTFLFLFPILVFTSTLKITRIGIWFYQTAISIILTLFFTIICFGLIGLAKFDTCQMQTTKLKYTTDKYDIVTRESKYDCTNDAGEYKRYNILNLFYYYTK